MKTCCAVVVLGVALGLCRASAPPTKATLLLRHLRFQMGKEAGAGRFVEAAKRAKQIEAVWKKAQGARYWMTLKARDEAEHWQRLAKLSKEDSRQLVPALVHWQRGEGLAARHDYRGAITAHRQALVIFQKILGEQHPVTAGGYGNIATCLRAQGKYAEARTLFEKALAIYRSIWRDQHADHAVSYGTVAVCLTGQNKHAEALPLFEEALAINRKVLGEQHPTTATSYNNVGSSLRNLGKCDEALTHFNKGLEILRKSAGEEHLETAACYTYVSRALYAQDKHEEALTRLKKALTIYRKILGEQHPTTAQSYSNAALCLYAQKQFAKAADHWRSALLGAETGRLDAASTGFERSQFRSTEVSPRLGLALVLARLKKPTEAWQHAESWLARGLLDDLDPKPLAARTERLAEIDRINRRLLPLVLAKTVDDEQKKERDTLTARRKKLTQAIAAEAAKEAQKRIWSLARIRKQIPADAALVLWLDGAQGWSCLVRAQGDPVWVELPGTGVKGAWNNADESLAARAYKALHDPTIGAKEREKLLAALHKQRIAPLEPHLKARGKLPAVRHLIVVAAGPMAEVPVEALTDKYTVSYTPSGTLFARSMEKHRALKASSLLALGDPVFAAPEVKDAAAPEHGLLIRLVLPGSAAARADFRAGDVLLTYNGVNLKSLADLKPVTAAAGVTLWRNGKKIASRITPIAGQFGFAPDSSPVALALKAWRATERVQRGETYAALPGTRREVEALARLIPGATKLLGSKANEQQLESLAKDGKLKSFRIVHLATHGEINKGRPGLSALVLSQDKVAPRIDEATEEVLKSGKAREGKLTVDTIRTTWKLDADLVVLSACSTGLGRDAAGEGLLGFAQALLSKGAHSVVLSRWKVDDAATALLMLRFYENLLGKRKGLKKPLLRAEALWEAKKWLRNLPRKEAEGLVVTLAGGKLAATSAPRGTIDDIKGGKVKVPPMPEGDKPFAHPRFWAAFVLIGDPF